jgi:hypothetical protein
MPSMALGKVATRAAGTVGTGSLGVSVFMVLRMTLTRDVTLGIWAITIGLGAAVGVVSCLRLVLEYMLRKLEVEVESRKAQSAAELRRARLEVHRAVMEKAMEQPSLDAQGYQELILVDALHLSAEEDRRYA